MVSRNQKPIPYYNICTGISSGRISADNIFWNNSLALGAALKSPTMAQSSMHTVTILLRGIDVKTLIFRRERWTMVLMWTTSKVHPKDNVVDNDKGRFFLKITQPTKSRGLILIRYD